MHIEILRRSLWCDNFDVIVWRTTDIYKYIYFLKIKKNRDPFVFGRYIIFFNYFLNVWSIFFVFFFNFMSIEQRMDPADTGISVQNWHRKSRYPSRAYVFLVPWFMLRSWESIRGGDSFFGSLYWYKANKIVKKKGVG